MILRKALIFPFAFFVSFLAIVQVCAQSGQRVRIKIERADFLRHDDKIGKNTQSLNGNVLLSHHKTYLHCDSAYMYNDSNVVVAYGNIHIIQNDSIHLYGNRLTYYGDQDLAKIRDNVRANKGETWLYTEFLDYNRALDKAYFYNGGRVVNGESELVSDDGLYYPNSNDVYFKNKVVGTSPKYTMHSDTAAYNTHTEIVSILGPTTILTSDSVVIESERGWYNTQTDEAQLVSENNITSGVYNLTGDSILYKHGIGQGWAWGNMVLTETEQDFEIHGDYGFCDEKSGDALVTDKALALQIYQGDTLFVHADTFRVVPIADTTRLVKAYYNTKFYRVDMQGRCDSLVFDFRDSIATMYIFPILWAQGNQMTANEIKLYTANKALYKTDLIEAAFVVSPEESDSASYNQVKGKLMTGHIRNNDLYLIDVDGNGQTLYYPKDGDAVIGINRAECSNMSIWLKERKIKNITMRVAPTGNMNPPVLVGETDKKLAGFRWFEDYRPKSKEDIFELMTIPDDMIIQEEVYEGYSFDELSE